MRNAYELKNVSERTVPNDTPKGHLITGVEEGSIAEEMGVEAGDVLLTVNDAVCEDIFDYRYQMHGETLEVLIRKADGEEWLLDIEKDGDEDLGMQFGDGLMSAYRSCANRCIFCFIDQNPEGMRETIYFKDDDARLSFLQGNYITLTNMSDHDIDRIIKYHLSPINISFHTTDPELRVMMLGHRGAGKALDKAKRLADPANGIELNGQIVLCKGINDGENLHRTLSDLYHDYRPSLKSVSVVPVGLTAHREGLYPLEPFTKEDAGAVIKEIASWQERSFKEYGDHFVHASDEWYITAGEDLPAEETYDGYIQYENGVGILRCFHDEFTGELRALKEERGEAFFDAFSREVSVITGMLDAPHKEALLKKAEECCRGLKVHFYPIRNDFYGERITVTGLLTGGDIIAQLKGRELGEALLIPDVMLRAGETVLLDDITAEDIGEALDIPVRIIAEDGAALVHALFDAE